MPAAIVARELDVRLIESVCIASYHDYKNQGELQVLKDIAPSIKAIGDGTGRGVLVVDDLTDTGQDRQDRARHAARTRISPRSTPSRPAGRWSTPS